MIREIHLTDVSSLKKKTQVIKFTKGVNIIIGPKGGGKSTLFNLLAGVENGIIPNSVITTLKDRQMVIDKIVYYSGEERLINSFKKIIKSKDVENIFDKNNNVI
jgi:energy-coupling factor transporter ATP-binding protein EcfA2